MTSYIGRRVLWALTMAFGIVVVDFLLTHILPGDPIMALVGNFPAPAAYIEQVRHDFGLDRPLPTQLWLYLRELARGDLGFSFANRQPVLTMILERAGPTMLLMVPSLSLASVIGILIAIRAAASHGRSLDTLLTAFTVAGYSVPVFWLAQILIVLFAVDLGWLPAQGIRSLRAPATGVGVLLDFLKHLVLPAFCITIYYLAVVARVARSSMVEMLHQDFVLTARAKGLTERQVLWCHVLRNGLIPVITVIGYNFGYSLTGAILTETAFAWPGLGSLFVTAISNRDYPVLSGIFLLAAIMVVLANLITDLLYAAADPRVRIAGDQT